jgi:ABC-type branched-subunit amino acid transport system permease subunit
LGAAVIAYLEEILITRFPYYYMLLFGLILVVVILFLPKGLVDLIQRSRAAYRQLRWQKGDGARKHANT